VEPKVLTRERRYLTVLFCLLVGGPGYRQGLIVRNGFKELAGP
jgi:hypothetical protein